MGNHQSQVSVHKAKAAPNNISNNITPEERKNSLNANSGYDIQEKENSLIHPVEKLAQILSKKSQQQEHINGITFNIFTQYLFPRYDILGEKLYNYMLREAHSKASYLSTKSFKEQSEKLLSILEDDTVLEILIKMFCNWANDSWSATMTPENLKALLMCDYHIAMEHYSEGPQMCLSIYKTLNSVVESCFHGKGELSRQYITKWLSTNCSRLLLPLHKYIVHCLTTSYRTLEAEGPNLAAGVSAMETDTGLEMATPVLGEQVPFGFSKHPHILQMSMCWLLAGALPPIYSEPQKVHSQNTNNAGRSNNAFLAKLLNALPSHWLNLYDSDEMGLGTNRFLHHVLAYKGPTLCLIKVESGSVFCLCSAVEWKESNLYWGNEESAVYQLLPKFLLLEKGAKLLYLNTCVRGYPFGLRAGTDPRSPIIIIDKGFEKMQYQKIPYNILKIEVWGCGDQQSRNVQLDIKKWQVKEAERQRAVKLSTSEWLDHPDRYLLELAGRPQYHQK